MDFLARRRLDSSHYPDGYLEFTKKKTVTKHCNKRTGRRKFNDYTTIRLGEKRREQRRIENCVNKTSGEIELDYVVFAVAPVFVHCTLYINTVELITELD